MFDASYNIRAVFGKKLTPFTVLAKITNTKFDIRSLGDNTLRRKKKPTTSFRSFCTNNAP
jgi:hypothetical protein